MGLGILVISYGIDVCGACLHPQEVVKGTASKDDIFHLSWFQSDVNEEHSESVR